MYKHAYWRTYDFSSWSRYLQAYASAECSSGALKCPWLTFTVVATHVVVFSPATVFPPSTQMSVFVSRTSPVTAKTEWIPQSSDYDYYQEIARSSFADMLHDTERNKKYELGLANAIRKMHSRGKVANVLDIGTGTGLLSMMAARNGADTVTSCEAFQPIAECAREVIKRNGLSGKIKVIAKRSTDLLVGPGLDMEGKANILVAEVFDTELIGEGAVETFSHAHRCLLEDDCLIVPAASNMYILPVESEHLWRQNRLLPIVVDAGDVAVHIPSSTEKYNNGLAAPLYDTQLSQLPAGARRLLTEPVRVFRFDFSVKLGMPRRECARVKAECKQDGTCHALLMWWNLEFDKDDEPIILSCAPSWARPTNETEPCQWRDHWMQAVFYPRCPLLVTKGESLLVSGEHDEYSLTFDISKSINTCSADLEKGEEVSLVSRQPAECYDDGNGLLHCAFTRARLGRANDPDRAQAYVDALREVMAAAIKEAAVCLCFGDGCLLPLLCVFLGAAKVWAVETSAVTRSIMQRLVDANSASEKIIIVADHDCIPKEDLHKVTLVLGEPHFHTTLMPWDNLYFWYARSYVDCHLPRDVLVLPSKAVLMAVALQFDDLWKIRAPVGTCEGFDLSAFDEIVEKAIHIADDDAEPLALWEYPSVALSQAFPLLEFDFAQTVEQCSLPMDASGHAPLLWNGTCNGVAMWMEYDLVGHGSNKSARCTSQRRLSQGPRVDIQPGARVLEWSADCRQAVYLLKQPAVVCSGSSSIDFTVSFKKETGDFKCHFSAS